jgi:hypothetical protein
MQSFQSLLDARCGTNGRNPEDGKDFKILAIVQQVLKVALLFPVLERGILPLLPQGSVGQGEERVSSLRGWGDGPDEGFLEQPHTPLRGGRRHCIPGQVLCIIEALKVMNEIESDVRGKVVKILVENGETVEYNQPLFLIDTNV